MRLLLEISVLQLLLLAIVEAVLKTSIGNFRLFSLQNTDQLHINFTFFHFTCSIGAGGNLIIAKYRLDYDEIIRNNYIDDKGYVEILAKFEVAKEYIDQSLIDGCTVFLLTHISF